MKRNRIHSVLSLYCILLSHGMYSAAMQSPPVSSSGISSSGKVIVCALAATTALVGSALGVRTYLNNQKRIKPEQPAASTTQPPVATNNQQDCKVVVAQKIIEVTVIPAVLAQVIAEYVVEGPKKISRSPFYGFNGRPSR